MGGARGGGEGGGGSRGGTNAINTQVLENAVAASLQTVESRVTDELEQLKQIENMKDEELEKLRERRREALKKSKQRAEDLKAKGHGTYISLPDEKAFFQICQDAKRAVVHFARSTTERCTIVDAHLTKLAASHLETRFVKVDAEKSPFLVQRLRVWMLPSIVLVVGSKVVHTIAGFDEFGGVDTFDTKTMEKVLIGHKVLDASSGRSLASLARQEEEEEEEEDLEAGHEATQRHFIKVMKKREKLEKRSKSSKFGDDGGDDLWD